MSARWDDTDARLHRIIDGVATMQIALLDIQRAVFAEREAREQSRLLIHDGSAIPDDMPPTHACDDEPPEAR